MTLLQWEKLQMFAVIEECYGIKSYPKSFIEALFNYIEPLEAPQLQNLKLA